MNEKTLQHHVIIGFMNSASETPFSHHLRLKTTIRMLLKHFIDVSHYVGFALFKDIHFYFGRRVASNRYSIVHRCLLVLICYTSHET